MVAPYTLTPTREKESVSLALYEQISESVALHQQKITFVSLALYERKSETVSLYKQKIHLSLSMTK
jgi:hypothetical protein